MSRLAQRLASPVVTTLFGIDRGLDALPRGLHDEAIWIPTAAVEHHIGAHVYYKMPKRLVQNGDWDVDHSREIATNPPVQQEAVEEFIVRKIPLHETARYQRLRRKIEIEGHARGIDSDEDLEEGYFQRLVDIYQNIRDNGIKSRRELLKQGVSDGSNILVLLDRQGSPVLLGGKHRFAICGILAIPEIPVQVVGVHRVWARSCVERLGGSPWSAVLEGIQAVATTKKRDGIQGGSASKSVL
ncbi:MAG: hypothetical protein H0X65_00535 [Gemmatimonadetes bacterium]|nr:hypothetical protein [Gemmatimonadota bacterium]